MHTHMHMHNSSHLVAACKRFQTELHTVHDQNSLTKSFKIKFVKVDDTKQDDAKAKQLQKELKQELQKRIRQLTLHTVHATLAVCLPLEGTPLSL